MTSVRYNKKLGKWRKKYGKYAKPNSIPQEIWNKLWEYWNSEEFKVLSQKTSQNHRSEKAGEGSTPSKHIGGSKTTIQHSTDLVKVFCQFNFVVNFVYAKNTNLIKICQLFRRLS